jgi:transcriptional regulator with AAA-type ATPase domain
MPPLRQRIRESPRELSLLLDSMVRRMTGDPADELVVFVRERLLASAGADYDWPGNVRELEQAVRRILVTRHYEPQRTRDHDSAADLGRRIQDGSIDADELLSQFCRLLYQRFGTFEEVARRANLDARTVKRYLNPPRVR